ncbi:MAG: galactokinase, partial [Chitinophagaceae bacterium]|nr:galactokinase [Chitinophagaceae bacterium]
NFTPKLFFSPGRINLIGEHVDYNDGYVMPAAIDKGVWFAIAANGTNMANFFSADLLESYTIDLDKVAKNDGWRNYVLGVLHIFHQEKYAIKGFDCAFGGDLPVGAGLSSSAAVEGGLIFALNNIFNIGMDRVKMALLAQKAEHSYAGVNCGIMDMFASLNSKKDHVTLLDCNTLMYEYFPLQLNEYAIMLINTKVSHSLASGEYNKRRKSCEEGLAILKQQNSSYTTFRNIPSKDVEMYKALLDPETYKRCLFVTQEIERTKQAAKYLQQNNLIGFGKLMFECHDGLSKLYDVSCPESDFLVEEAKKHASIIGSRQMGGGFGGCTINIIEKEKVAGTVKTITAAYQQKFNLAPDVYEMATSNGTYEIIL